MGFYHITENPCVMMRVNHKTKSFECIIIHQDELYIASITIQEIFHIVKEKYKTKIYSNNYLESNFPQSFVNCNINLIHKKNIHINIYMLDYIHDFILYTRNFLYEMESKYCIMGSINQNKE